MAATEISPGIVGHAPFPRKGARHTDRADVCVVVDGVIYSLQRYGGLIRYWDQLLVGLTDLGVEVELRLPEKLRATPPVVTPRNSIGVRIFHSTYFTEAPNQEPSVVTVHDCIYETHPELVSHLDTDSGILKRKKACIESAAAIVVPSRTTETAIRRFYPALSSPIHVVPEGIAPSLRATSNDAMIVARSLKRRAASTRPYLLHVGGRAEYKGFLTILRAFAELSLCEEFDLVVVGSEPQPRADERDMFAALPAAARVVLLGQVSDPVLSALYSRAAAVVSASTIEGFGLPVLEAAALGTAVACTNIPAYGETVGTVAQMFEAGDPDDCARAIHSAVRLNHDSLVQRGQSLATTFSWERMAVRMRDIYHQVAI